VLTVTATLLKFVVDGLHLVFTDIVVYVEELLLPLAQLAKKTMRNHLIGTVLIWKEFTLSLSAGCHEVSFTSWRDNDLGGVHLQHHCILDKHSKSR